MSNRVLFFIIFVATAFGILSVFASMVQDAYAPGLSQEESEGPVVCETDALLCADGSSVGRTGPSCDFICPDIPPSPTPAIPNEEELTMCTADAMLCPDGSYVGRSLPGCQFRCPDAPIIPGDIQEHIDSMSDLIKVTSPRPGYVISSPLELSGEARGGWFFEASAPVSLVNWDGLIIAEGYVTAQGDWMTAEFVPFTGSLEFVSPYKAGDADFMKRGTLIFQNDNPSGLPENAKAVEIPVIFESQQSQSTLKSTQ